MRPHDYIIALFELIRDGKDIDVALDALKALLKRKGQTKLYPRILTGLLKQIEKSSAQTTTTVVIGREKDAEILKHEIETTLNALNGTSSYETSVDATIIGGFKIKHQSTIVDKSYKRQLVALYRSLIE